MHQGTEGHPIIPAGGEVLDVHVLVATGLGSAPVQQHLLDAVGVGDSEAGRMLYGVCQDLKSLPSLVSQSWPCTLGTLRSWADSVPS